MPRTIINLPDADKAWLDREAAERHVSMATLVREAVHDYRIRNESSDRPNLSTALERTAGLWRREDGLTWQRRLRDEWETSR